MKKKKDKLTEVQKAELVKFFEESILKAEKRSELLKKAIVEYKLTTSQSEFYYDKAQKNIIEFTERDLGLILDAHVFFYEQLYKFFLETKNTFGISKTLSYKEKLLGLHREDTLIEVNNNISVETTFVEDNFDFSKLSKEKRDRLEFLMNKSLRIIDKTGGEKKSGN